MLVSDDVKRQADRQVHQGRWLCGPSAAIEDVRQRILAAAAQAGSVLITGEPGTGRRQTAWAIHQGSTALTADDDSTFHEEPSFHEVHCAALELEGTRWDALLGRAAGGTLYLVAVDTLSRRLQDELLERLQSGQIQPRTSGRRQAEPWPITARVIAASVDLDKAVTGGRFTGELRDRLGATRIALPSLRQRREDVPVLVDALVGEARQNHGGGVFGVSPEALQQILGYDWPGNVAELERILEPVLDKGRDVTPAMLPEVVRRVEPLSPGDLLPERIGPYRIEARLGSGGMGEVYRGHDPKLDRPVAVKRVAASRQSSSLRDRLRREARLAAKLNHPGIVQIYHLLEDRDHDHIVMELVEGESLGKRMHEGSLELAEAVGLACDIAGALREAHQNGILHRDLKADNVIITPAGRAKILDFGIAKTVDKEDSENTTDPQVFLGTVYAMSPERVVGAEVDLRSDLFSFGSLLYRMTTGERPFEAATPMQVLTVLCTLNATPVREHDPRIPEGLESLIDRLLAKEPDLRPTNDEVCAVLEGLRATLSGARPTVAAAGVTPDAATAASATTSAAGVTETRSGLFERLRRLWRNE